MLSINYSKEWDKSTRKVGGNMLALTLFGGYRKNYLLFSDE
jgi:hypothetical protein